MPEITDRATDARAGESSAGRVVQDGSGQGRASWRGRLLWAAGLAVAAVVLSWCYILQARTEVANSDGAGSALMGFDMLHGNILLRGWWTADVSFATFEVPIDALVIAARGLSADVVHVTAGIVYAMLVLAAALVGRGTARGRAGIFRALLAAGVIIAPGLDEGTRVLLGSPDHIGVGVPILLTLLLVDRARERWWVPVVLCVLLVWAQLDDPVAEFGAALPVALVCIVRAGVSLRRDGWGDGAWKSGAWRYEAGLAVAAALSYELTEIAVHAIRAVGGYSMRSLSSATKLVPPSEWPAQCLHTVQNAMLLFGADYFWQAGTLAKGIAFLHLIGFALALAGLLAGVVGLCRLFFGGLWGKRSSGEHGPSGELGSSGEHGGDRVTQILTAGTILALGAGALANSAQPGYGAHEIAVVLPFGAALTGRIVGPWLLERDLSRLARSALATVLSAVAACYLAVLGYSASQPSVPAWTQSIDGFLAAHNLTSGIGMYWAASITTATTNWHVRVIPAQPGPEDPYAWVTKPAWYNPDEYSANFVIAGRYTADSTTYPVKTVLREFGPPAREYKVDGYVIMVYDRNLLRDVHRPVQPSPDLGSRLLQ